MKISTTFASSLCFEVPINDNLNVVAVYDDLFAGEWAEEVAEQLAHNAQGRYSINKSFWKLDLFQIPTLRRIAALKALEADILVVAANPASPLPAEMLTWIDDWLPNKHHGGGTLIALLRQSQPGERSRSPAETLLKRLAATARMRFILRFEPCTVGESEIPELQSPFPAHSFRSQEYEPDDVMQIIPA